MTALASTARLRIALGALLALLAVVVIPPASAGNGNDAVYALTNAAGGNAVAIFTPGADGTLTAAGTVPTGGLGSGNGLGSQGALALDRNRLFAVNAGSSSISLLGIRGRDLALLDVEPSGGVRPISVAVAGRLVYVLNEGDAGHPANITGFVATGPKLEPLAGSSRPLSAASVGPAQIAFSPGGTELVVTEKTTNSIDTYTVGAGGYASGPVVTASAGATPFGFAFDPSGRAIVSEAFGGAAGASAASSYSLAHDGTLTAISPSIATTETAACWIAITADGRYAYASNTGSGTISGYAIGADGSLTLLDAAGVTGVTGAGSAPADSAVLAGVLYVRNGGNATISAFRIGADGSLDPLGTLSGLQAGLVGLVAG